MEISSCVITLYDNYNLLEPVSCFRCKINSPQKIFLSAVKNKIICSLLTGNKSFPILILRTRVLPRFYTLSHFRFCLIAYCRNIADIFIAINWIFHHFPCFLPVIFSRHWKSWHKKSYCAYVHNTNNDNINQAEVIQI